MQLPLILRGILNIDTYFAGMRYRRIYGAVGATGPVSASHKGQAAASVGSTVAQPSRPAANQPVAHEMGEGGSAIGKAAARLQSGIT